MERTGRDTQSTGCRTGLWAAKARTVWAGMRGRDGSAAPARYGSHATIELPFWLAQDAAGLVGAVRALATRLVPANLGRLTVSRLGGFLALVPDRNPEELAAAMVEGLGGFRAPPGEADLMRRRAAGLMPAQDALLKRWGYRYVLKAFRTHITLTGRDPKEGRMDRVEAVFTLPAGPHRIASLALAGEGAAGCRFHLIEELPLGAHAGT